jgi:hypothetical protein
MEDQNDSKRVEFLEMVAEDVEARYEALGVLLLRFCWEIVDSEHFSALQRTLMLLAAEQLLANFDFPNREP